MICTNHCNCNLTNSIVIASIIIAALIVVAGDTETPNYSYKIIILQNILNYIFIHIFKITNSKFIKLCDTMCLLMKIAIIANTPKLNSITFIVIV